jgi:uncharacterized membrane protein
MVPSDFTLAHAVAITLLFAAWWLYSPILKLFGRGTLNAQLGVVRLRWMSLSIARQNRTFDALLLNQVISSVAFFGSATLIVVAGLIGTFANVKAVHAVIADLHFFAPMSVELLAINLGAVALILGISFFSFTYPLRKLIYTVALMGGLPEQAPMTPALTIQSQATATVLSEAIRSFNNGIRGYYYAVAALFLLAGPVACICATCLVMAMLFWRQTMTRTSKAIASYVDAVETDTAG